jgi:alpha-glucosidase
MNKFAFPLFVVLFSVSLFATPDPLTLSSPSKIHTVEVSLSEDQSLHAKVMRGGQLMVKDLSFGFTLVGAEPLGKGLAIKATRARQIDERYAVVIGKSREARNHCQELIVELVECGGLKRSFELHFRAYDDGIAFRYGFPKQEQLTEFVIEEELSRFEFPSDETAWVATWNRPNNPNETEFSKTTISAINPKGWLQCPVTIERADGIVLSLYQAAVTDYAGIYYCKVDAASPVLQTRLSPIIQKDRKGAVVIKTPQVSPWRVIQSADTPAGLIASDLVLNLNEPCKIKDTSWIQAGKMTFPWWANFDSGIEGVQPGNTFETGKAFVDFAASHNIRYHVVEPRWYTTKEGVRDGYQNPQNSDALKPLPEMRIQELIRYAKEKNVEIFLWIHWSLLAERPDEIMKVYKSWGAVGMKVDFFDRTDQEMVRTYHLLAEKAAQHQLMLFYHGAYAPDGLRRTWPNIVTREGVMGNEYCKWSKRVTLQHTLTLPFTRMIPGPMDFTPGGFRNVMPEDFKMDNTRPLVMGTRSRELAKFVIYESPIQMLCDAPGAYLGQPGTDFLKLVPSTWDETRGLQGQISQYCVVARKSGENWFLGAMTDEQPRSLTVKLDFLEAGKRYQVTQWCDPKAGGKPTDLERTEFTCQGGADQQIVIQTARGGGAALVFTKVLN